VHGTTRRQVAAVFEEERKAFGPLPASVYESYQEGRRRVQRDSFVEVAKAYYEAPPEFIGRQIWVRWDGRMVRLLNERMEQIGCHARLRQKQRAQALGREARILWTATAPISYEFPPNVGLIALLLLSFVRNITIFSDA
jgi:hypothetical protein